MTHAAIALPFVNGSGPAALPRHTHDCGHCRFIGQVDVHGEPEQDVYVCPNGGSEELILRRGSGGGDYSSLPTALVEKSTRGLPFAFSAASILLAGLRDPRYSHDWAGLARQGR